MNPHFAISEVDDIFHDPSFGSLGFSHTFAIRGTHTVDFDTYGRLSYTGRHNDADAKTRRQKDLGF